MKKKLLVIDDKLGLPEKVRHILVLEGHDVFTACNLLQGIKKLYEKHPDLIITDLLLPKPSDVDPLQNSEVLKKDKDIPIIILSKNAGKETINKTKRAHINQDLKKPYSSNPFVQSVYTTIHQPYE